MKAVHWAMAFYKFVCVWAGRAILSLFLLGMRLIWGYQFFIAGKGKLANIERPIAYFTDLHIPFPTANAWLVACVECFGGALLIAGVGSRAVAFALTINMMVAYLTTEHEALMKLFQEGDPSKFFAADPFWFLLTAVLVLALGPGWFSVDGALKPFLWKKCGKCEIDSKTAFPVVTTEAAARG